MSAEVRERLKELASTDVSLDSFETLLHDLAPDEINELQAYVARRVDIARRMPPVVLWRIRRKGESAWKRLTAR